MSDEACYDGWVLGQELNKMPQRTASRRLALRRLKQCNNLLGELDDILSRPEPNWRRMRVIVNRMDVAMLEASYALREEQG